VPRGITIGGIVGIPIQRVCFFSTIWRAITWFVSARKTRRSNALSIRMDRWYKTCNHTNTKYIHYNLTIMYTIHTNTREKYIYAMTWRVDTALWVKFAVIAYHPSRKVRQ
jgi:hypothetical protein